MEEYLHSICRDIYCIIDTYIKYIDNTESIENILHSNNITKAGEVSIGDINDVVDNGNIRECVTVIFNFGLKGHHIIMELIINEYFRSKIEENLLNIKDITRRLDRLKILTGINDINILQKFISDMKNKDMLPSMFASFAKDGPILASKGKGDIPFIEETRTKLNFHNKYEKPLLQYSKDTIYPKLSNREKKWLELNGYSEDNISWISGCEYYIFNDKSFYKKSADYFNQLTLSGLSGTTDLVLDVMSLFNKFNLDMSIYSCILWMCCGSVVDHTVFEVLIATISYGSDFTIDKNALEYCKSKKWVIYNYDEKAHDIKIVYKKLNEAYYNKYCKL
jgi:hypothetical protein